MVFVFILRLWVGFGKSFSLSLDEFRKENIGYFGDYGFFNLF